MDKLRALKKAIVESAPSYDKMYDNKTATGNIIQAKSKIGFTRVFYSGFHIEGDKKIWDRRFKTQMFKNFKYFGPRGELLWLFGALVIFRTFAENNMKREKIDKHFVDRNVFYYLKNNDGTKLNKIE